MRCDQCGRQLLKVDRREEMAELDDGATEGQETDYLAAELSGDNGAWSVAVIEYRCPHCKIGYETQEEELTNYKSLILGWHEKAAEGDHFSRFIFEYLAFIAHLKNNIFFTARSDRGAIQALKRDEGRKHLYLEMLNANRPLLDWYEQLIQELRRAPLHNSSQDLDNPEIDRWWNTSQLEPWHDDPLEKGVIHSADDWENTVEFWCSVRNNLFHGGKNPNVQRDLFLVMAAYKTLKAYMDIEIDSLA
jgi:phage FluMu protein Com